MSNHNNPVLDDLTWDAYDLQQVLALAGPSWQENSYSSNHNSPDIRTAPPGSDVSKAEFVPVDIAKIIASSEGDNDGPDWLLAGQLHDGRYFHIAAGCDYTGWDCQSGGTTHVAATYDDLLRFGMGDDERQRLGLPMPAASE